MAEPTNTIEPAPPGPEPNSSTSVAQDVDVATTPPTGQSSNMTHDIQMTDASNDVKDQSPAPPQSASASNTPAPAPPARTGTPSRLAASGQENGSRAASQFPDPGFVMPNEAPPHGASARRYLNTKVTGVLLEGMKQIAKDQPKDPLRVLGEYLLQRSKELEGTS